MRGAWGRRVAGQFRREDQWGLRFLEKALQVRALGLLGNGRCQDTDRGWRDEQVCGEPWRGCLYFSVYLTPLERSGPLDPEVFGWKW